MLPVGTFTTQRAVIVVGIENRGGSRAIREEARRHLVTDRGNDHGSRTPVSSETTIQGRQDR
jgi:hypothetical protein